MPVPAYLERILSEADIIHPVRDIERTEPFDKLRILELFRDIVLAFDFLLVDLLAFFFRDAERHNVFRFFDTCQFPFQDLFTAAVAAIGDCFIICADQFGTAVLTDIHLSALNHVFFGTVVSLVLFRFKNTFTVAAFQFL